MFVFFNLLVFFLCFSPTWVFFLCFPPIGCFFFVFPLPRCFFFVFPQLGVFSLFFPNWVFFLSFSPPGCRQEGLECARKWPLLSNQCGTPRSGASCASILKRHIYNWNRNEVLAGNDIPPYLCQYIEDICRQNISITYSIHQMRNLKRGTKPKYYCQ